MAKAAAPAKVFTPDPSLADPALAVQNLTLNRPICDLVAEATGLDKDEALRRIYGNIDPQQIADCKENIAKTLIGEIPEMSWTFVAFCMGNRVNPLNELVTLARMEPASHSDVESNERRDDTAPTEKEY